jgi:very-short-patch-repair endonuclease
MTTGPHSEAFTRQARPVPDSFDDAPWLDPPELARVLTRAQARALGFTARMIDRRLATATWQRILPSTYLTRDTFTWPDRLRAALAFAGPDALLTGAAALCDLGLRGVARPEDILVLVPIRVRKQSTGFVRIRSTRRMPDRELSPGPRRATNARAIADLALERTRLDDVRALVAEAVRRALCTVEELVFELETGPRNGSAHLREAIIEVGGGAWSAPEALAATLLRRAGVPRFQQNAPIRLPDGSTLYVDFLWRRLRAILEIDSVEHHDLPPDADATDDRHLVLETLGYSVAHRKPRYIRREPERFTHGVAAWLAARARHLAS